MCFDVFLKNSLILSAKRSGKILGLQMHEDQPLFIGDKESCANAML